MNSLYIAIAPVVVIIVYIYYRDKYEKEPKKLLIKALVGGMLVTFPLFFVEQILGGFSIGMPKIGAAFYNAFFVASLMEEAFKYLAFYLLIWDDKNFNELFDGIIYAVYISLGFATIENIMYVISYGEGTGILRAFTAVPAHALFGIVMGYYFGLAKFIPSLKKKFLIMAILIPFVLHGIYDFLLMSGNEWLMLLFIPFVIFMWIYGFKKMKLHSENSIYKDNPELNA
ncbi:MAG: PrsW family intramembrane metalloprotease [Bacteroidales bacterium]|nr:PrsW family intramembrane metalloprotease [Bacteroidales bacterium]MBN2757512.1 PrsW family intramembrane metalloprotease [Bacteroidales bacterium]